MRVWRYIELDKISHLRNEGRELLGKYIYFTEKRDGSCLATWMRKKPLLRRILNSILHRKTTSIYAILNDYDLMISSRNQIIAEGSISKDFKSCGESGFVLSYLVENPTHVIFGEILRKGLSPTRIENHEKVEFIVFDIYDGTQFLTYQQVHQTCYHYGMKCVHLFGEGRFTSMESLLEYRDQMLEICKQEKREGVVLKTFNENGKPLYAKEKLDTAKPRGHPKLESGKIQYPPLPFNEAIGAVDKAYADLGEDFSIKKRVMPIVAKYIQEEMRKHLCSSPEINFYDLYRQYCRDHNIEVKE